MKQYKDLVNRIMVEGEDSGDRTKTGTKRIFGHSMTFDLSEGFPLVTMKHTSINMILHELLWFISGVTNTKYLTDNNVNIWNEWADDKGDLGAIYGNQWRNAGGNFRKKMKDAWVQDGIDQLGKCVEQIKTNHTSRRIIVDSWDVKSLPEEDMSPQENVGVGLMSLAPCHMMFQFFVHSDGTLDLQVYQRSCDVFLGLPYNIASYAALIQMVAQVTGKVPGRLIWTGGDIHLYKNHKIQVESLMNREPLKLPSLELNSLVTNIDDFTIDDFSLLKYEAHPSIKAPIAI